MDGHLYLEKRDIRQINYLININQKELCVLTVKTYYVSRSGGARLSNNFLVKEFQSHDGSDKVLIDTDLVLILQNIRNHFGEPVTINSAYRTPAYNASIGGSSASYHVKGQAADIKVKNVNPVIVAMYAQKLNVGGIGLYAYTVGGFVHIDTRPIQYRWLTLNRNEPYQPISKILPTIKENGSLNITYSVKLAQRKLGITQSGHFGGITRNAVEQFQAYSKIKVDGIIGTNTWTKLFS